MNHMPAATTRRDDNWLPGGGMMGALVRAHDWSVTPLGSMSDWPQSLRTAVRICLHSRYPMFVWWGEHLVNIYNDAYIPILGRRHPEALGRLAPDVWHEIWPVVGPQSAIVLQEERATWNEQVLLVMQRHGFVEETYFTFSYSPVHDDDGRVAGVFCACSEETARVLSERRVRTLRALGAAAVDVKSVDEACARLSDALSENPFDLPYALVYLFDGAGTATLRAMTGLPPGSAVAAESVELSGRGGAPRWPVEIALGTAGITVMDVRQIGFAATLPGGAWPEPSTHAALLPIARPGQDRPTGALVLGLSPRRPLDDGYEGFLRLVAGHTAGAIANARVYEDERRRAEALAELDRAKTAFFSNVSHEFRTPITLMLGPTEDALASPARSLSGEALEIVYRNELRLLKLVNALLDFSRLEAGRLHATFEPTDLAQLTADLASAFRSAFERAGLTFDVACDPISVPVYVDRGMWEQIVLNLLSNALKFTFDGGVWLRVCEGPEAVTFEVRDTGIGIDARDLPHVFERFHRIEGARARTHEGSGIGLALVNDLVRLHGGSCTMESVPGEGTTARVTLKKGTAHLPRESVAEPRPLPTRPGPNPFVVEALHWIPDPEVMDAGPMSTSEALPQPGSDPGILPGHVLVADDNADMRGYLTRLLRQHWSVDAVGDGESALQAVHARRPDLVLCDVMMPRMNGFELLRALRDDERTAAIPIVMLSARAGEEARIEGVRAGADEYLVKPFSARELVARVNAQLRLAHAGRERVELLARERDARREAELQKQHLHSLFMQAPTAIVVLRGPHFVIELANDAACAIWGRRHEDVIGRPLFEALPEIRDQTYRALLDRVYASGEPHVGSETPARLDRNRDGRLETVYLTFAYAPLRTANDDVDGVLVIAADVTDQVRARREMSALRESAEAANRAKDEFLAMLGHELRNPLAPILTALQLLKLRGIDAVERERVVIERQVKHVVALVDDLLDVSRITRGKIELRKAMVEAADIVATAIETASPLLEQQRHELRVDVPRAGLTLYADAGRLAQVLANLLTNAAKYTEPGGTISITGRSEGADVVLRVRDTGIGIEPDMLPRVFDIFFQERQTLERSRGGLGLGLAIVRSLVALHDGTVGVASAGKGEGSEFTIRLPRAGAPSAPVADERPAGTRAPLPAQPSRVLIVDDNHDGALLLQEMLSVLGYVARVAHDGPAALRLAGEFHPDIALLDIGLPVMDGYELARRFASSPELRRTRLVAVTGYGQEQDRRLSAAAGFDAHLVKPVDMEELHTTLERLRSPDAVIPDPQ